MAKEPTFTDIEYGKTGIPGTKVYVSNLEPSTKYYWRVNASNAGGIGTYSEAYSFTTGFPVIPVLASPENGATVCRCRQAHFGNRL